MQIRNDKSMKKIKNKTNQNNTLIRSDRNLIALGLVAVVVLIGAFTLLPKPNNTQSANTDLQQIEETSASEYEPTYENVFDETIEMNY